MSALIKIVVYTTGFCGFGYVLMKVTEPNADKIKSITESSRAVYGDELKRKQLIVQRLKEAAEPGAKTIFGATTLPPPPPSNKP